MPMNKIYYFNIRETYNHVFGYSSSASEVMDIIGEMYYNTVITLGYILYIVLIIIALASYYFNSSNNYYPTSFNKRVEYLMDALFVLAPIFIIYCLSIPALGYIMSNDISTLSIDSPFNIEIVGHQWYWTYYINTDLSEDIYNSVTHYIDNQLNMFNFNVKIELEQLIVFDSDLLKRCFEVSKYIILPVGETIRCEVTSVDVIHSWAVPQLGIKVDAIPGRIQTFYIRSYITGVVYGQCSEFCGENHAFMPIIIEFVEIDNFLDWIIKELNSNPYQMYLSIINNINTYNNLVSEDNTVVDFVKKGNVV